MIGPIVSDRANLTIGPHDVLSDALVMSNPARIEQGKYAGGDSTHF